MFAKKKLLNKKYIDVSLLAIWYLIILSDIFSKTFNFALQGIITLYVLLPILNKEKPRYPKVILGGLILSGVAVIQSLVVK